MCSGRMRSRWADARVCDMIGRGLRNTTMSEQEPPVIDYAGAETPLKPSLSPCLRGGRLVRDGLAKCVRCSANQVNIGDCKPAGGSSLRAIGMFMGVAGLLWFVFSDRPFQPLGYLMWLVGMMLDLLGEY